MELAQLVEIRHKDDWPCAKTTVLHSCLPPVVIPRTADSHPHCQGSLELSTLVNKELTDQRSSPDRIELGQPRDTYRVIIGSGGVHNVRKRSFLSLSLFSLFFPFWVSGSRRLHSNRSVVGPLTAGNLARTGSEGLYPRCPTIALILMSSKGRLCVSRVFSVAKFGPLYLYPLLTRRGWHLASCPAAIIEVCRD